MLSPISFSPNYLTEVSHNPQPVHLVYHLKLCDIIDAGSHSGLARPNLPIATNFRGKKLKQLAPSFGYSCIKMLNREGTAFIDVCD